MDLTLCPECAVLAEIQWRDFLESTDGPVEHAKVLCARRHWFLLPVASLAHSSSDDLANSDAGDVRVGEPGDRRSCPVDLTCTVAASRDHDVTINAPVPLHVHKSLKEPIVSKYISRTATQGGLDATSTANPRRIRLGWL
jgi:hypothetical protein